MNKRGEIVIVDDDSDDLEMFSEVIKELKIDNKPLCFTQAAEALEYLRKVDSDPFFIMSDYRMPIINGLELKQMIYTDENLIKKAIPFILYSVTIDNQAFNMALSVGVQGFFVKPAKFGDLKKTFGCIHEYLCSCFGN
jgi:CheY-like chemotaxis protein